MSVCAHNPSTAGAAYGRQSEMGGSLSSLASQSCQSTILDLVGDPVTKSKGEGNRGSCPALKCNLHTHFSNHFLILSIYCILISSSVCIHAYKWHSTRVEVRKQLARAGLFFHQVRPRGQTRSSGLTASTFTY